MTDEDKELEILLYDGTDPMRGGLARSIATGLMVSGDSMLYSVGIAIMTHPTVEVALRVTIKKKEEE